MSRQKSALGHFWARPVKTQNIRKTNKRRPGSLRRCSKALLGSPDLQMGSRQMAARPARSYKAPAAKTRTSGKPKNEPVAPRLTQALQQGPSWGPRPAGTQSRPKQGPQQRKPEPQENSISRKHLQTPDTMTCTATVLQNQTSGPEPDLRMP